MIYNHTCTESVTKEQQIQEIKTLLAKLLWRLLWHLFTFLSMSVTHVLLPRWPGGNGSARRVAGLSLIPGGVMPMT